MLLTRSSLDERDEMYYNLVTGLCNAISAPIVTLDTDMKFDVIIGNPPYQAGGGDKQGGLRGSIKNLYTQFIIQSVDLLTAGGVLSFITPPGYLKTTHIGRKSPVFELMQSLNLKFLDFNCKHHFPSVSLPSITRFVLLNDTEYETTRVITSESDECIDLSGEDFVPLNVTKDLIESVRTHLSPTPVYDFRRDDTGVKTDSIVADGDNYVLVSQISGGKLEVSLNEPILNRKGKVKLCHVMRCESQEHARQVYEDMTSDSATFINSVVRYGDANVYPGIINHLIA